MTNNEEVKNNYSQFYNKAKEQNNQINTPMKTKIIECMMNITNKVYNQ